MAAVTAIEGAAPPASGLPLRQVAAVGVGNALAFYDFLTFSFFAIQIGHTFFPGDSGHSLLATLAAFGVGFITRPIGGMVIGAYADRAGRKPAMILAFTLMGVGMIGLALTPSARSIGWAAPVLMVTFRLVQGFALGGEVGPSTAFLVEAAPPNRRGLYLALQYATQDFAVLVAGVVGFTLASRLAPADLDAWGWRVAFLAGAAIVPLGLMLRRALPETHTRSPEQRERPRIPWRIAGLGLVIFAGAMISNYTLDYMTTFAQDSLKLPASAAFGATIVLGVVSVACDLTCGPLADRLGRKPVMLSAGVVLLLATVPAFMVMTQAPSGVAVWVVTGGLGGLLSFMSGPGLMIVTESLPRAVRSGVLGTVYAFAVAGFGGTTQVAIKALMGVTGSSLTPAWYMTAAVAAALAAMVMMRETAPAKIGHALP